MHVHVMGNKGVNRVVNSFINGGKDEMRNTLVHVYNVYASDYKRMAEHNIYVTEGMLWHHAENELQAELLKILPEGLKDKGYPMKSYFDNGVNISSHSDFPAVLTILLILWKLQLQAFTIPKKQRRGGLKNV